MTQWGTMGLSVDSIGIHWIHRGSVELRIDQWMSVAGQCVSLRPSGNQLQVVVVSGSTSLSRVHLDLVEVIEVPWG